MLRSLATAACCIGFIPLPTAALGAEEVVLESADVRLTDITAIPNGYKDLGDHIVARIPAAAGSLELTQQDVERILRRQAPGLDLIPLHEGTMRFATVARPQPASGKCNELQSALSSGDFLDQSHLRAVPCSQDQGVPASLTWDSSARGLRALEDLPAGTYLGELHLAARTIIPAQTAMTLQSRSGPVLVQRRVRTIQPVRAGEDVFVITPDGSVLSARTTEASE